MHRSCRRPDMANWQYVDWNLQVSCMIFIVKSQNELDLGLCERMYVTQIVASSTSLRKFGEYNSVIYGHLYYIVICTTGLSFVTKTWDGLEKTRHVKLGRYVVMTLSASEHATKFQLSWMRCTIVVLFPIKDRDRSFWRWTDAETYIAICRFQAIILFRPMT
jgi:hypothetical protein